MEFTKSLPLVVLYQYYQREEIMIQRFTAMLALAATDVFCLYACDQIERSEKQRND
jgi:hypothetical protein